MCLADDDFYLSSGLSVAMRMLDANKGIEASMGQSIGLDVYKKSWPYFFSYGDSLKGYRVEGETASGRMRKGICNYRSAAFYAIFRREAFAEIWKDIKRSSCPEQIEYEQAMRAYMVGTLVTTPQIYWVRSFECDPVASPIDGARSTNFSSWFCSPAYEEEKIEFIDRLVQSLITHTNSSEHTARAQVLDLCNHIVSGSHVGLTSPPKLVAEMLIKLRSELTQGLEAGWINGFRNSQIGIQLRMQFLHFSRRKFELSCRSFSGDVSEASSILSFVGQFHSVGGGGPR
jgi:hypothetical protein